MLTKHRSDLIHFYSKYAALTVSVTVPRRLRLAVQICCNCLASAADQASRAAELQTASAARPMHADEYEPTRHQL